MPSQRPPQRGQTLSEPLRAVTLIPFDPLSSSGSNLLCHLDPLDETWVATVRAVGQSTCFNTQEGIL